MPGEEHTLLESVLYVYPAALVCADTFSKHVARALRGENGDNGLLTSVHIPGCSLR